MKVGREMIMMKIRLNSAQFELKLPVGAELGNILENARKCKKNETFKIFF